MRRYDSVVDSYNAMVEDPEGKFVLYDDVAKMAKAEELLKELVLEHGEIREEDGYGRVFCVFCREDVDDGHEEGCFIVRAIEFVESLG